jgi:hypothetical protein
MGPPLGRRFHDRDGIVVDYLLGATFGSSPALRPAQAVHAILIGQAPDPAGLLRPDEVTGQGPPGDDVRSGGQAVAPTYRE